MKIANIEFTKEKAVVAVSSAIAAVVLLVYFIFYAPLIRELMQKGAQSRLIEDQLQQAHELIGSAEKPPLKRALAAENDISQAQDELTKYCSLMGIAVSSMSPKEIIKGREAQTKILPIEMKIKAGDQQFAKFIGSLDRLKKSLIKVRGFDLSVDPEDKPKLKSNLLLDMYISSNAE